MLNLSVGVIIPAYNEEEFIENTIKGIKKINSISEIIVVDDGSNDNTVDRAMKQGVKVISLNSNKGKGNAIKEGLKVICSDIIILVDADLGYTASEAEKLLSPIFSGQADVTIADIQSVRGKGGFGFVRRLARYGVKKLSGHDVECVLSGQRAMRRELFDRMGLNNERFDLEIGMTVELLKMGYRIQPINVNMNHRRTGKSFGGFIHRIHQFKDIFLYIYGYRDAKGE